MAENLKACEAIREVIGYDNDLMLECYMGWNVEYAKGMLPKLATFQPRWLEEPVIANDIDGYAELNAMNIVPISGGEHEFGLTASSNCSIARRSRWCSTTPAASAASRWRTRSTRCARPTRCR